jgi:hypothetical protein
MPMMAERSPEVPAGKRREIDVATYGGQYVTLSLNERMTLLIFSSFPPPDKIDRHKF